MTTTHRRGTIRTIRTKNGNIKYVNVKPTSVKIKPKKPKKKK